MLIYTLDPLSLEQTGVLEVFESVIWAERFIDPGDTTIVMGATHENAVALRPGTMLLHEESDEPMLIETRDIKDGVITATGKTIEAFFNERYVGPLGRGGFASNIIRYVADNMQTRQGGKYAFPNLRIQDYVADTDVQGHEEHILEIKPGHDALLELANKYSLGIAVKRQHNPTTNDLELVFVVRYINDRTQPDDYISFSPDDDTFAAVDELYSLSGWKDVILVHAPKTFAKEATDIAYGWWPMSYPDKTEQGGPNNFALTGADNPFEWRIQEITSDDIDQPFIDKRINDYWWYDQGYPDNWSLYTDAQKETVLRAEMKAKAKDEWHNRQTQRKVVFDGQVPGEILKYGRDYKLGDIVMVEGTYTGGKQKALVTEHIRSSDNNGTKSYPTLAPPLDVYEPDPSAGYTGGGGNY